MMLAGLARGRRSTGKRGRRSTAKSWATGHRRPPIATLKFLLDLLKDRRATINQLIPAIEFAIMQREREPPRPPASMRLRSAMAPAARPTMGATGVADHDARPPRLMT